MTIAIPVHRALSTKLAPRGFNVVTRWGYNPWLARVNSTPNNDHDTETSQLCLRPKSRLFVATRSYATKAAAKPASRPKAHTGRTTAKRSTKASPEASTSSKPGPKTAAGKKAVGRKPQAKTTKKPRAATKTVPKPKKPAVKKAPSASALLKQRRANDKELKEKALLNTPKQLPASQWTVFFSETQKATPGRTAEQRGSTAREASQKFKNFTPEEKEHYNHIANQNKAANLAAEKKWLAQFTPDQIREANNARAQLKRQYKEKRPNVKNIHKFPSIKDDRLVTRPRSSYLQFSMDRYASGDFAHMTIAESSKLVSREWKALDTAEKKKFDDQAQADTNRYIEEYTSVFGKAPAQVGRKGTAKAN